MVLSSLESLHRRAKGLEASLEVKIQSFSVLAQKMNADFLCDEESATMTRTDEDRMAKEIDRLLIELNECISSMKEYEESVPNFGGSHKDNLIKRYDEIYFDYKTEFQSTSTALRRKRESVMLFESAEIKNHDEENSATAMLLDERNTIANSMRNIGDVIGEATEAKVFLKNQRGLLDGGFSQLGGLNTRLPTFDQVIDGIQKKKFKDQAIIAAIIGLCLIFIIWWTCLRE